jgi:hypothetical protein
MNTSPSKTRTVEKTVEVDKQKELEIRLALHELYAMQLPLHRTKRERIREYLEDLRSPEVDFAALMSNTLLDEDNLRWVEEDYELFTIGCPEWRRPAWVKKFVSKRG